MPVTMPSARSAVHRIITSRPLARPCFRITQPTNARSSTAGVSRRHTALSLQFLRSPAAFYCGWLAELAETSANLPARSNADRSTRFCSDTFVLKASVCSPGVTITHCCAPLVSGNSPEAGPEFGQLRFESGVHRLAAAALSGIGSFTFTMIQRSDRRTLHLTLPP